MKRRTSTKMKGLSAFLSVVLLIAAVFPNYALAAEQAGTDPNVSLYSALDDEDLSINAEVATCIAELFVRDMIATGTTVWDETTEPVNTVTMYDETGETPTAFSVELTEGYVIVSAYIDVPDIILEWSDTSTPYYYESASVPSVQSSGQETKIVYLGALDYYIDNGNSELKTVSGETVERASLSSSLDNMRSSENISQEMYSFISENTNQTDTEFGIQPYSDVPIIDNAGEYASQVYGGGTWTCHDYANHWEKWAGNCTYKTIYANPEDRDDYACCPISITNLIMMDKQKKYQKVYPKSDYLDIYNKVKSIKSGIFFTYYVEGTGVYPTNVRGYVTDAFKKYGEQGISIRSHDRFTTSDGLTQIHLTPIINTCTDPNRLMLMYLYQGEHHPYGTHYVVGYAYCRLEDPNKTKMRTFVKIRDCTTTGPRYLDVYNFGTVSGYLDIDLS